MAKSLIHGIMTIDRRISVLDQNSTRHSRAAAGSRPVGLPLAGVCVTLYTTQEPESLSITNRRERAREKSPILSPMTQSQGRLGIVGVGGYPDEQLPQSGNPLWLGREGAPRGVRLGFGF